MCTPTGHYAPIMHRGRWQRIAFASVIIVIGCSDEDAPTATGAEEHPTTCEIWSRLVDLDTAYVKEEPFMFERRDRLSISIRAALGQIRMNSYLPDDPGLEVAYPTMVLERGDFSESGLLTPLEAEAARDLDDVLSEACDGVALSPGGLLLSSSG